MNQIVRMSRRSFVIGSAAVGGGLALGLELPSGLGEAAAIAATTLATYLSFAYENSAC